MAFSFVQGDFRKKMALSFSSILPLMILQQFSQDFLHASLTKNIYPKAWACIHFKTSAQENQFKKCTKWTQMHLCVAHTYTMDLHAPSRTSLHTLTNTCSCTCGKVKPHDPEKLLHIWVGGFNNWLQRETALKANCFLPEWQASSSTWAQMRQLHNETHGIRIRQQTAC